MPRSGMLMFKMGQRVRVINSDSYDGNYEGKQGTIEELDPSDVSATLVFDGTKSKLQVWPEDCEPV